MSEVEKFISANPDVREIDAFIIDLCGNAVGKRYPVEDLAGLFDTGSRICAATYLLDAGGGTSDPLGKGFSDGDPDAVMKPVANTLVPAPWAGDRRGQCLMTLFRPDSGEPVWFEPRTVLQRVLDTFSGIGIRPVIAIELEFYLLDKERDANGFPQPPRSPFHDRREHSGQVYGLDILDEYTEVLDAIGAACEAQGIPASVTSSEFGAGQFEINLRYTDDVLKACDQAALLRRAIKCASRTAGFESTFLSKPFAEQAGSGMHIHMSLRDRDGAMLFDPSSADSEASLEHAVAGMQATMHEAFALFAPNINAYRRFEPDQFVPVTRDWGIDNRSMAFRIVEQFSPSRRIEHRVAGAEANPYLVAAAVLAGAHHGLCNHLAATSIASGNAGSSVDESLPLELWRAIAALRSAEILPQYFGADYIEAYAQVKESEFREFMGSAFAREFDWYL